MHHSYTIQYSTYTLTEHSTGGNPSSYVTHNDITAYCSFFSAPGSYLGDLSAYLGGKLVFSLNSTDTSWTDEDVVVLIGAGMVACFELPAPPPAPPTWESYQVPLTAAGFTYDDQNGAPVSVNDFDLIMADVQVLLIPAEFGAEIEETVGLDSVGLLPPGVSNVLPSSPVRLHAAVPNPFNPMTTIAFSLDRTEQVSLAVFDLNGRLVRTLLIGSLTAGRHEVKWQGRDDRGSEVASGVYLYRLVAGPFSDVGRMALVR